MQFLKPVLDALADEHGLTSDAKWLLAWLVISVPRDTVARVSKVVRRCSATTLADWLRAPRSDETQENERLSRTSGGSLRRRLGVALRQLHDAGLVEWTPGNHGHEGTLVVSSYEALAADGNPDLGPYVPIYQDRIEEWCVSRRLDFDARVLLLRTLLETDPVSLIAARSATEMATTLGIGKRRAARLLQLDGDLRGALQRTAAGIETVVYRDLVAPIARNGRSSTASTAVSKRAPDQGFHEASLFDDPSERCRNARPAVSKRAPGGVETRARPACLRADLDLDLKPPPTPSVASDGQLVPLGGEEEDLEFDKRSGVDTVLAQWRQQWPGPQLDAALRQSRVCDAVIAALGQGVPPADLAQAVIDLDAVNGSLLTAKALAPTLLKRISDARRTGLERLADADRRAELDQLTADRQAADSAAVDFGHRCAQVHGCDTSTARADLEQAYGHSRDLLAAARSAYETAVGPVRDAADSAAVSAALDDIDLATAVAGISKRHRALRKNPGLLGPAVTRWLLSWARAAQRSNPAAPLTENLRLALAGDFDTVDDDGPADLAPLPMLLGDVPPRPLKERVFAVVLSGSQ